MKARFRTAGSGFPNVQSFAFFNKTKTNETTKCQTDLQRFIKKKGNY